MSSYSKSSKGLLSFKLKTIPLIILTTFSQHGQAEENSVKNNASTSLAQPSVDDANEIGSVNVVRPMVLPSSAAKYDESGSILLSAKADDDNAVGTSAGAKEYARSLADDKGKNDLLIGIELQDIQVRAKRLYEIGPLRGLALTKEEIPGNVQSISAKEIKESRALSISDLMNSKLQSVNVNDYQSNPFQMDVTYRGFTASPQLGTAQGLSVFLDGIRVNEPFGDVVNWDMLPLNALAGLDVFPGSNPIFGLGTLGGALSMRTKSGFDAKEGTIEALGGSFNRKQIQGSVGGNNGVIAGFVAANIFNEDGWRDNSPSKVNQLFAKGEWRNDKVQIGLSTLYAGNDLIGNGMLPTEVARQDPSKVFTSPDQTKNNLLQFQLTGLWDVSDTFNITGQIYNRKSKRKSSTADINQDFEGRATRRPNPGEQVIPGYADINNDGLPDYNALPFNIAADASGNALDTNGNTLFVDDGSGNMVANPASNGIALVGTDFNALAHPNQAMTVGADGVTSIPSWTYNPVLNTADFSQPIAGFFNTPLSSTFYQFARNVWQNKVNLVLNTEAFNYGDPHPATGQTNTYVVSAGSGVAGNYTDNGGFFVLLSPFEVINAAETTNPDGTTKLTAADPENRLGKPFILAALDSAGRLIPRDGAGVDSDGRIGTGTGYVNGTPNAIITKTEIDQISDGAALQLNWNLEKHKFMVGASYDAADSTYASSQMLGLFDANHRGALAPDRLGYEYYAATHPVALNNFKGDSNTKSLYFSETWTPTKTLNFTGAARYNYTTINNYMETNNIIGVKGVNSFINQLDFLQLCKDVDGNGTVEASECQAGIDNFIVPFSPSQAMGTGALRPGEREKFHYYSFNPSFGATWQANDNTNVYSNWSRGARTPTVIELGCAFDDKPVPYTTNPITHAVTSYRPRSLAENRFCSLPSALSGDPYLKQVRSETIETGIRGKLTENIEWNASIYRTDLQDDIYFVSFRPERSFFTNIGNTRRQGLEMGLKGKVGKASFALNYALTDATFQSAFNMGSPNNSEAGTTQFAPGCNTSTPPAGCSSILDFQRIKVQKGNRMPGIPLHNLNASFAYEVTPDWTVGLTAIMHSDAFVRGNENNKHRTGPATPIDAVCSTPVDNNGDGVPDSFSNGPCKLARPDFKYPGKTPGYAVFNFNTAYKITKGLTAGLQINNLFDRTYYSAGRLGINAFAPSIRGAINPVSGFNYNSNDWTSSTFLAPGAPRSAFFTLTYDFDIGK